MPRPRSVTFLALALFGLGAYHLLGAAESLARQAFLAGLPLGVAPAYLAVRGAAWGAGFGLLAAGLWRQRRWGLAGTLLALALHLLYLGLERRLLGRSDFSQLTAPYALGWAGISLAAAAWILLRREVRRNFS